MKIKIRVRKGGRAVAAVSEPAIAAARTQSASSSIDSAFTEGF